MYMGYCGVLHSLLHVADCRASALREEREGTQNVNLPLNFNLILSVHFPFKFSASCPCKFFPDRQTDKLDPTPFLAL